MKKTIISIFLSVIATTAIVFVMAQAGDLNPSSAPGDTMYTLEDIYCKITNCATSTYGLDSSDEATSTMYTLEEIYDVAFGNYYGKGWVASSSGNASTSLTQAACEEASGWVWFEDANGDGDTIDPEDGLCVATSTVTSSNWGGTETNDNSYIAAYTCAGAFPNGYVASGGSAAEGCALCVADCYDGRKDLPDNGGYTADASATGYYGPITPEVLKNWKGTRLPTFKDFFGYCGTPSGAADDASGDSYYYSSGATSDKALGYYGQNVGRGANGAPYDEYINLSRTSYEWLSEPFNNTTAQIAGSYACSRVTNYPVTNANRFRAVFRP
jgi:hypothetical protein